MPVPRVRVLVIEDNKDLAQLFRDLLDVMNCETEVVFDAQSGIEAAMRSTPHLVFSDLRLPGQKNGMDIARELRSDPRFADTTLLAVTGDGGEETQRIAAEAGFDRIFIKPIKFADLDELIHSTRTRREGSLA